MRGEVSNYDFVIMLLNRVAELINEGDHEGAIRILDNAIEYADEIENITEKTSAFIQIARAFFIAGKEDKSREILDSIAEELRSVDFDDKEFLEVVVDIEKLRLSFVTEKDKIGKLEKLRERLERVLDRTRSIIVARYYIAFLTMLWLPVMMDVDIEKAESVIGEAIGKISFLREDPQYAELLTALAEIYARISKIEEALENLKNAISIYRKNIAEFEDTIRAILNFVKENFPDKYDDFLKEVAKDVE